MYKVLLGYFIFRNIKIYTDRVRECSIWVTWNKTWKYMILKWKKRHCLNIQILITQFTIQTIKSKEVNMQT